VRPCKADSRADDRLMHPTQMAWEKPRNIIRSLQVHDPDLWIVGIAGECPLHYLGGYMDAFRLGLG
jgi:hypothetical protein